MGDELDVRRLLGLLVGAYGAVVLGVWIWDRIEAWVVRRVERWVRRRNGQ